MEAVEAVEVVEAVEEAVEEEDVRWAARLRVEVLAVRVELAEHSLEDRVALGAQHLAEATRGRGGRWRTVVATMRTVALLGGGGVWGG